MLAVTDSFSGTTRTPMSRFDSGYSRCRRFAMTSSSACACSRVTPGASRPTPNMSLRTTRLCWNSPWKFSPIGTHTSAAQNLNAGRHHAHDGVRMPVQRDRLADHAGIAAVACVPQRMGDHGRRARRPRDRLPPAACGRAPVAFPSSGNAFAEIGGALDARRLALSFGQVEADATRGRELAKQP